MGKVRRDWFEIFAASECQASAKAAVSHTVTVSTPFKGWNFKPSEGANIDGTGYLVRAKDGVLIRASGDRRVWERQIVDFEFLEGIEWTPQQIAAITDPGHTHDIAAPVGLAGPKASVEYGALMAKEPWIEVEVSVTPEMIAAGKRCECSYVDPDDGGNDRDYFTRLYRAMAAHAPVELISDGERIWHTRALIAEGRVAELEGIKDERDDSPVSVALKVDRNQQSKIRNDQAAEIARLFEVAKERNALIASLGRSGAAQMDEIALLRQALGAEHLRHKQTCDECMAAEAQIETLRTELMAARDTIARFTAANVPDPPKADPIANAIRPRATDRRRIGG